MALAAGKFGDTGYNSGGLDLTISARAAELPLA
jgi:hypothetical protein